MCLGVEAKPVYFAQNHPRTPRATPHLADVKPYHIIVTGPESSGKTTLSRQLAAELDGVWVPEYPRGYLEAAGRRAVLSDFDHFATVTGHLLAAATAQLERRQADRKRGYIVQDTGAEVLQLWMDDKFEQASEQVKSAFRAQQPKLYLLCRPDLAWEYDPLREDPHRRDELFVKLRTLLDENASRVVEISGLNQQRLKAARQAIPALRK